MLTDIEKDIVLSILNSKNNKQICQELLIEEDDLKKILNTMYSKFNLKNRLQLIIYCINNELI